MLFTLYKIKIDKNFNHTDHSYENYKFHIYTYTYIGLIFCESISQNQNYNNQHISFLQVIVINVCLVNLHIYKLFSLKISNLHIQTVFSKTPFFGGDCSIPDSDNIVIIECWLSILSNIV